MQVSRRRSLEIGLKAAKSIGNGLYGVDLKEANGGVYVIEVNDNPSSESGEDNSLPGHLPQDRPKLLESN